LPESVEQNIPTVVDSIELPAIFGFAESMEIIVPLVSGRPFITDFHSSLFSSSSP
jgi:hypothetical protein